MDSNNIITDVISYPVEGYTKASLPRPLPIGIMGGWWKYVDGVLSEIPELNPTNIDNRIQQAIDAYTLELIEGGLL